MPRYPIIASVVVRWKLTGPVCAQLLLWLTVGLGLAVLGWSTVSLARAANPWVVLVVLPAVIIGERLKVSILEARRETLSFSLSVVVIMAAATLDPPLAPVAALV